jgi:hypothetical protein
MGNLRYLYIGGQPTESLLDKFLSLEYLAAANQLGLSRLCSCLRCPTCGLPSLFACSR